MMQESISAPLRVLDLFSGIGGFSLGLERTGGFKTVAFCEMKPHAQRVLEKNFPGVPCHDDVTTCNFKEGEADVITAGFPCQDISYAGLGAGLAGTRSGLYREVIRAIRVVRPFRAVLENVAALLGRGLGAVLGDLATVGYDAEWHCIPASAVGAPHRRDRVWIVANPGGEQHEGGGAPISGTLATELSRAVAYTNSGRAHTEQVDILGRSREADVDWHGQIRPMAYSSIERRTETRELRSGEPAQRPACGREEVADTDCIDVQRIVNRRTDTEEWFGQNQRQAGPRGHGLGWWAIEPDVGRVAHGVPMRVDRLAELGNAVVPQIPEIIGRAILASLGRAAA